MASSSLTLSLNWSWSSETATRPGFPAQEEQRRFQTVFRRFLGVFARAEHPLVLFLDDLQWLDLATLELVKHLLIESELRHFLLVGAYRDNEVVASHALARTLKEISYWPVSRYGISSWSRFQSATSND